MPFNANIKGLQETQAAVLQAAAAVRPTGALGQAVKHVTLGAHRYAVAHTVVDTGSWRAAHLPEIHGATGRIFVDPAAVNPKSDSKPSIYGPELELTRGDRYAVYRTTAEEAGPGLLQEGGQILIQALP